MNKIIFFIIIFLLIAIGLFSQDSIKKIGVNTYEAPKVNETLVKFPYKICYIWRLQYKLAQIGIAEYITFSNKFTLFNIITDSNLLKIECIPSTYHYLDEEVTYLELAHYKFIAIRDIAKIENKLSPIRK